jgi:hypothetical protein
MSQCPIEFSVGRGSSNVAVVLVHEVFGFDNCIETVADNLSQAGFWAAAVDLYRGIIPRALRKPSSCVLPSKRLRYSKRYSQVCGS